jgi:hypothetical protein
MLRFAALYFCDVVKSLQSNRWPHPPQISGLFWSFPIRGTLRGRLQPGHFISIPGHTLASSSFAMAALSSFERDCLTILP